MIVAERT